MPCLTFYFIRSSLINLFVGFSIGMLLLWQKGAFLPPEVWRLLPLHLELLTFGWIIQLVMGVAFWILPRFSKAPVRGNETIVWVSFITLNIGILLYGLQSFLPEREVCALIGRLLEFFSILCYGRSIWKRIKPFGEAE